MLEDSKLPLKLVILDADRRILVENTGSSPRLPEVQIPQFTRIAHSATVAAREKCGLELFVILAKTLAVEEYATQPDHSEPLVLVCRLQDVVANLHESLTWTEPKQAAIRLQANDQ